MAATNTEVWQAGTVVEAESLTAQTRRLVIAPALPRRAEPGTHIDVMVTINGERQKRSYSVVDSSEDGQQLAISVFLSPQSRGGAVFMQELQVGDRLEITQPLQNFPLRVGAPRYVLLAGGIGITAMVNMARVLRNIKAEYVLVYAGRSRAAMAYLPQLEELHGGALRVHVDDEGTALNVDELLAGVDPESELYMCGPIRLMDAVKRGWQALGLSLPNLRYETFGNSGWFDPEEFVVRVPRLGVEATVGAGKSMLEALEDAGVDVMFDCRKGECGLCEVRLLGVQGTIDHRDVFYSERQQHAAAQMCCCVSRAVSSDTGARSAAATERAVISIDL
ncbi:PDR/VanB family oxidoreductase [Arthrobacter sp. AL08]|uniref:PDR/VanB family oxidoreductase n=1 Tax=Micrococcaceae TaxID=1268 RepID=UPI00249CD7CD|nr:MULTISPECIES: PDR/VanB family oxidoreductase [Micrococcaceae]MDI3240889.1 PDR/VanB family oxidoreductase [Arthrobacter sp. AL05]MDI3277135.1 PDR/VanB family oxidoreductase [Arthrobacter sp. AL08]MDJ0352384.1 PDR/VanB family oxidoreductase [Pseudarthrobacter sp. PH31-O2]